MVGVSDSTNGIDCDVERAICAVFEADGEGEARSEFAVELGLGGAGADGAEAEQVGDVLGRNGVEHLARQRHADGGETGEKLSSCAQAFVDVEAVVHVWVVDQTLPADGGTGFFEISSHDNHELVLVLWS